MPPRQDDAALLRGGRGGNGVFIAADLRCRYQVIVRGDAASAGVVSRDSVWESYLDAGTVTKAPAAVVWVPLGAPLRLAWVVSRPWSAPGTSVVAAELHNRKSLPDGYKVEQESGSGLRAGTSTLMLPSVTAADDGRRFVANYFVTCGGDLYSENAKTAVTTLRVHPAACPAGLDAQAAEYGGADLMRGDGHHLPSYGCNVYVFGFDGGSARAGECWLKRSASPRAPVINPWTGGGASPWVSGVFL
ncbi:hypothetical protein I4F81_011367 [Pyropia yezoensis]|uniref:Uncharacterized protein n=1 Tax=Pyropia yezoensis TaxID=2788 RepID=A0ACC3CFK9_PYRYE|nr:hypothetical protein I4F81_011367 [Neopyropia yezoensis]